ncbi:MAG: NAD(P)H-binding protein [Pseudomonadota bacterium]
MTISPTTIAVFGASGATGLTLCEQALAAGHCVIAAVRRPQDFPIRHERLTARKADVSDSAGLADLIAGTNAVCSTLGAPYSRKEITVYSQGALHIVAAMRETGVRRLVVVSAGLTFKPPKVYGPVMDWIVIPLLRGRFGKTLYEDMRRMESLLETCDDIDWTIMRPARLEDREGVTDYTNDGDFPLRNFTARSALAAAMCAELGPDGHIHQRVSPTTR